MYVSRRRDGETFGGMLLRKALGWAAWIVLYLVEQRW
jgi:hypothetical protein